MTRFWNLFRNISFYCVELMRYLGHLPLQSQALLHCKKVLKSPVTRQHLPSARLVNVGREHRTEQGSEDPFQFLRSSGQTSL